MSGDDHGQFISFLKMFFFSFSSQKSKRSFDNFDPEFTDEAARLTPCDKSFIANINQNDFHGFSFVNAEFPAKEKEPPGDGDINV